MASESTEHRPTVGSLGLNVVFLFGGLLSDFLLP